MTDLPPLQARRWLAVEKIVEQVFSSYDFFPIRFPIVESTGLFSRSIGEVTDIVEKEMYSFPDRNGESLTLRPEGTAGCVRACIENRLLEGVQKLWYCGPMFRYERPQKGRQRQFHQVGVEVFGLEAVEAEVEVLLLARRLWGALGISSSLELQLNTIGTGEDRKKYRGALVEFLQARKNELDEDSQRRLESNPLRILDSKNENTQALLVDAPQLRNYLSQASSERYEQLCSLLTSQGLAFVENHRLVRGLDYYNDCVFEWVTTELGAQGAVCAGGRYDGLVEQLGGKATPAVGFGIGVERLMLLLEAQSTQDETEAGADIFVIADCQEQLVRATAVSEQLRSQYPGMRVAQNLVPGSLKSQFKKANRMAVRYVVVVGEQEAKKDAVTVKDMEAGEQEEVGVAGLGNHFPA